MIKIPDIIIAIDGFSSTGKSSFAKLIAKKFDFLYLDSGALYRAVTYFAQQASLISPDNVVSADLERFLSSLEVKFDEQGSCCMGGKCIEGEIRSMKVSSQVSPVAALPYVRMWVDETLRRLAAGGRVVMDGRDIGVTVFPNAQLKIFMTARAEVRAERRFQEMLSRGEEANYEEVLENIKQRDYIDSNREASPLKRADDAFALDNSDMSLEEELAWITGLIQGKFGIL